MYRRSFKRGHWLKTSRRRSYLQTLSRKAAHPFGRKLVHLFPERDDWIVLVPLDARVFDVLLDGGERVPPATMSDEAEFLDHSVSQVVRFEAERFDLGRSQAVFVELGDKVPPAKELTMFERLEEREIGWQMGDRGERREVFREGADVEDRRRSDDRHRERTEASWLRARPMSRGEQEKPRKSATLVAIGACRRSTCRVPDYTAFCRVDQGYLRAPCRSQALSDRAGSNSR